MTRSRIQSYYAPAYLTPSPSPTREQSPEPSKRFSSGGDSESMASSRPVSLAPSVGGIRMPSLKEILTDSAPQPYTLGAFMAYLSQNHCLETLEFTMEADRYRLAYSQHQNNFLANGDHLTALWQKLIQAYIQPYGSREVNLPSHVRDHLLSLPCGPPPPDPAMLDEAVKIIYELMADSVLVPFVESFQQHQTEQHLVPEEKPTESRHGRSRSRTSKDMTPKHHDHSRSPRTSFLPHLSINMSRKTEPNAYPYSSTSETGDSQDMTDDSGVSPITAEPMTPPTTPPTPEWTFNAPPGSLHKAISAHSNGWKKVGAKLGLGRRSRSTHRASSSVTSAAVTSSAGL